MRRCLRALRGAAEGAEGVRGKSHLAIAGRETADLEKVETWHQLMPFSVLSRVRRIP